MTGASNDRKCAVGTLSLKLCGTRLKHDSNYSYMHLQACNFGVCETLPNLDCSDKCNSNGVSTS